MKPVLDSFASKLSPWQVYRRLQPRCRKSFFLDSIESKKPDQNYSYIGLNPFLEIELKNKKIHITGEERGVYPESELFPRLRALLKKYRPEGSRKYPFFTGGAVGYWGYELAPLFDQVKFRKKTSPGLAPLHLGFFREVIVYDHAKRLFYVVTQSAGPKDGRAQKRLQYLKWLIQESPEEKQNAFECSRFKPGITRAKFESMVKRAKEYIEAGDIYQANLSQRFSFNFKGSPLGLYGRLREINPSPFASFLDWGELKIISSSPERLVCKNGRSCETKPIAGTRPRPHNKAQEKALEAELRKNAKEKAEHIMLVDLERNDLGRVCEFESVHVEELMKIEKYSHVMHLVSKVTGKLRGDKDALDLLKAVFPGGTITGCPKIRCMEIIDELEPVSRGLYTGSIGYLDFYGDMDLNIVIRTLVLQKNQGNLQVGAGIVYDSDPAKEYEETLHKGEALVQALGEGGAR